MIWNEGFSGDVKHNNSRKHQQTQKEFLWSLSTSVFARQRKECQITSVRDRERQDRRGRNKVVFKGKGCSVTSDKLET